ncbi:uncharacterized protein LOC143259440 isoform X6 [Megalopta genalis]|uniref:uncharacterized protein LOC143259440 isoform X6 n=1 Tax=Megalopta genalis TaxID=115081 RepID=UPI003FD51569
MHARVMWKLPSSLWRERGRRLSVRWITGAELGRRISSSHWVKDENKTVAMFESRRTWRPPQPLVRPFAD